MFLKRFFMGALFVLLVFGAVSGLRHGGYEEAYREGFEAGQRAAASSESSEEKDKGESETAVPPQSRDRSQHMDRGDHHSRHSHSGFGWGFFPLAFLIGGFVKLAIFAFLIGTLFKFLGWGRHWRHHHKGHRPPWAKYHQEDEASSTETPGTEKSPEDVEPDIKVG